MDFDVAPADDARRLEVKAWLEANPDPTGRQLAEAGYIVPHWPAPWGIDADPMHQLIIEQELATAAVAVPRNSIGIGWAAPTIFVAGTDEQRHRYLPKIFSGDEVWCQLFSEPDSGSDLAGLATRAVRDGDKYVINGSKIWSSGAHRSNFGILLARTDPNVPKHRGISYFILPMDASGITTEPIIDMTEVHSFNMVFLDDVRIPASLRVGNEGDGWRLAKMTLASERVSLSSGGALWGAGPTAATLLHLVRRAGRTRDQRLRDRLAKLYCEAEILRLTHLRTLSARLLGRTPGPVASTQKILADEHGQHVMSLAKDLAGPAGVLSGSGPAGPVPRHEQTGVTEINTRRGVSNQFPDVDPIWHHGYVFSPALTLGWGTFVIQRNILAEQALGLPKDVDVEQGKTWAECHGHAL